MNCMFGAYSVQRTDGVSDYSGGHASSCQFVDPCVCISAYPCANIFLGIYCIVNGLFNFQILSVLFGKAIYVAHICILPAFCVCCLYL
jgi:hypothetical protein